MNDLISRQAAIAVADASDYVGLSVEDVKKVTDEVVKGLKRLPSAEPEIIHCKDCEYYHPSYCEIWSKYGTIQTREKGYCYMADRRGDDER